MLIAAAFLVMPFVINADGWTTQPSHQTLYVDTLTSKTDGSSVSVADSQGLFVTGDVTTLGEVGIGNNNPSQALTIGTFYTVSSSGVTQWGNSAAQGQLTWDTGKAVIVGLAGNDLSLGSNAISDQIYIKSGGNVGIGTTNPGSNKLHVAGNIHATSDICTDAGGGKCLSNVTGGGSSQWTTSGSNIYYNAGNVGVKNTNPTSELDVTGQLKVSSTINDKIVLSGSQVGPHTIYLTDSKGIRFWDSVNNELVRITNDGKFGIGTTPSNKFDILGSGSVIAQVASSDGTAAWYASGGAAGDATWGFISGRPTGGGLTIREAGVQDVMTFLKTSGNVGIGTTAPGEKLDVNGDIRVADGSKIIFHSSGETAIYENSGLTLESGHSARPINFLINGSEKMRVHTTGDIYLTTNNKYLYARQTGGSDRKLIGMNTDDEVQIAGDGQTIEFGDSKGKWTSSGLSIGTDSTNVLTSTESTITHTGGSSIFADYNQFSGWGLRMRARSDADSIGWDVTNLAGNSGRDLHLQETGGELVIGGNVGMGIAAPDKRLDVRYNGADNRAAIAFGSPSFIGGYIGYRAGNDRIWLGNTGAATSAVDIRFRFADDGIGGGTDTVVFRGDGKVGIGITGPAEKLHVADGNIRISDASNSDGTYLSWSSGTAAWYNGGSSGNDIKIDAGDQIQFWTGVSWVGGNAERLRIDSSGNIILLTNGALLDWNSGSATLDASSFDLRRRSDAVTLFRMENDGDMLLASTKGGVGASNLCYDGSGDSYWGACTSLAKYKNNVVDLSIGLETVRKLRPVEFDWNGQIGARGHDLGFIAEEVEQVNPLLVEYGGNNGALSSVKYNLLTSVLTNAIQELDERISELENQKAEKNKWNEENPKEHGKSAKDELILKDAADGSCHRVTILNDALKITGAIECPAS